MREAFHCALDLSDSDGFDCYTQLNCEMNRDTDIALGHLRTYQWRFFRQRASTYVADPKEFAVEVTRRDPETVGPATKDAKIFLHSTLRDNPAPISFRREEGVWRIYSNSL